MMMMMTVGILHWRCVGLLPVPAVERVRRRHSKKAGLQRI